MSVPLAILNRPTSPRSWCGAWDPDRQLSRDCVVAAPGPRQRIGLYVASQPSQGKDPNAEDGWIYWVPFFQHEAERDRDVAGVVIACPLLDELHLAGDWEPRTYAPGAVVVHRGWVQLTLEGARADAEPLPPAECPLIPSVLDGPQPPVPPRHWEPIIELGTSSWEF